MEINELKKELFHSNKEEKKIEYGDKERIAMIKRTFKSAFGREPTKEEIQERVESIKRITKKLHFH